MPSTAIISARRVVCRGRARDRPRDAMVNENGQESDMYAATYNEEGRQLHVTLRSETSGVRMAALYLD